MKGAQRKGKKMNKEIDNIIHLTKRLRETDSVSEKENIEQMFREMDMRWLDGKLVRHKEMDVLGRLFYSYLNRFQIYKNAKTYYKWNNNIVYCFLDEVEFVDEPSVDLEKIFKYQMQIENLEKRISNLHKKIRKESESCIHLVHPGSFVETNEVNENVFSANKGDKVFYSESFCEICGTRIIS